MMAYDFYPADRNFDNLEPDSLFEEYLNADYALVEEEPDRLADFNFGLDRAAYNDTNGRDVTDRSVPINRTNGFFPDKPSFLRPHKILPRALQTTSASTTHVPAPPAQPEPRSPTKSISPLKASFPALRRKAGKIFGSTDWGRDRTSTPPTAKSAPPSAAPPPPEMMGPYTYTPVSDWQRQFEQINLQAAVTGSVVPPNLHESVETCPPYSQYVCPEQSPRKIFPEHVIARQRLQAARLQAAGQDSYEYATLPVQAGAIADENHQYHNHIPHTQSRAKHSRQAASWSPGPVHHFEHGYSISPSHLHHHWDPSLHETTDEPAFSPVNHQNFEENNVNAHPVSLPSYSPTEIPPHFTTQYVTIDDNHTAVLNGGPPTQSSLPEQYISSYGSSPTHAAKPGRPCTPPSGTYYQESPSPKALLLADPPASARLANRSPTKRRSGKIGPLRQPKSAGNLKATKSMRDLKSPKSLTQLKSSKSVAGLRSMGEFGFVNFTPEDKSKILTGVAPSGSSKTKARREQEAYEKKRRLSEAAEKAILQAGGNPASLRLEGLL